VYKVRSESPKNQIVGGLGDFSALSNFSQNILSPRFFLFHNAKFQLPSLNYMFCTPKCLNLHRTISLPPCAIEEATDLEPFRFFSLPFPYTTGGARPTGGFGRRSRFKSEGIRPFGAWGSMGRFDFFDPPTQPTT